MREGHGACNLVTELPEVEIADGTMRFWIKSGTVWTCHAYPIHLALKLHHIVASELAAHYASTGKVMPFKDAG